MNHRPLLILLGLTALIANQVGAQNKARSSAYIGYVYPAGGQQGTTFAVRIGGQRIDGACGAIVSGSGVHAKLNDVYNRIGNQEMRLLKEQLQIIKKEKEDLDEETQPEWLDFALLHKRNSGDWCDPIRQCLPTAEETKPILCDGVSITPWQLTGAERKAVNITTCLSAAQTLKKQLGLRLRIIFSLLIFTPPPQK